MSFSAYNDCVRLELENISMERHGLEIAVQTLLDFAYYFGFIEELYNFMVKLKSFYLLFS